MTCACGKQAEQGSDECYRCRVSSVGFSFKGGGGYTKQSFHDYTTAERRAEILDGRVLGVDTEPASNYGW